MRFCPPGTSVSLYKEPANETDFWNRNIAYDILPDGTCLNDLLVQEGFTIAADEYY